MEVQQSRYGSLSHGLETASRSIAGRDQSASRRGAKRKRSGRWARLDQGCNSARDRRIVVGSGGCVGGVV